MSVRGHIPRALLAALAVLVFVPSGAALGSQTYADTAGDAPGGAPDITSVAVSHKLAGFVSFQVALANRSMVAGEDRIWLYIDSDQNKATGDPWDGSDYLLQTGGDHPTRAYIFRWDQEWSNVAVPVIWANGTLTFTVNRAQVGNPVTGFDFSLVTHTGGETSFDNIELVPHLGMPMYTYELATDIAQIQLPKVVTTVKAGKVFSISGASVKLTTDEVFTPETLTGKATISGKVVKPRPGGLSWKVPKAARGKKLVVTMTATYQGMTKTEKLALRVVK